MNVSVIGAGYVGLAITACLADVGHTLICLDKDKNKIRQLQKDQCPVHEEGLSEILFQHQSTGKIRFMSDDRMKESLENSDVVFLCVNTPVNTNGSTNLDEVHSVFDAISLYANRWTTAVIKTTVPIGTTERIQQRLRKANPDKEIQVLFNPEFLREGSAVNDFMNPSRIVVAPDTPATKYTMDSLYAHFIGKCPMLYCDLQSAEMIKYASNAFLATKIAFINEISDLCEQTGANIKTVSQGMGMDERIGDQHLKAGPGFGGVCFPQDTVAFTRTARSKGSPLRIVETVVETNKTRKKNIANYVVNACAGSVKDKAITVLGLAFKAGTDDVRNSASLSLIKALQEQGAIINAHDPMAIQNAGKVLSDVRFFENVYRAFADAQAIVVATPWEEYITMDLDLATQSLSDNSVRPFVDLHNVFDADLVRSHGFNYFGIGNGGLSKLH